MAQDNTRVVIVSGTARGRGRGRCCRSAGRPRSGARTAGSASRRRARCGRRSPTTPRARRWCARTTSRSAAASRAPVSSASRRAWRCTGAALPESDVEPLRKRLTAAWAPLTDGGARGAAVRRRPRAARPRHQQAARGEGGAVGDRAPTARSPTSATTSPTRTRSSSSRRRASPCWCGPSSGRPPPTCGSSRRRSCSRSSSAGARPPAQQSKQREENPIMRSRLKSGDESASTPVAAEAARAAHRRLEPAAVHVSGATATGQWQAEPGGGGLVTALAAGAARPRRHVDRLARARRERTTSSPTRSTRSGKGAGYTLSGVPLDRAGGPRLLPRLLQRDHLAAVPRPAVALQLRPGLLAHLLRSEPQFARRRGRERGAGRFHLGARLPPDERRRPSCAARA